MEMKKTLFYIGCLLMISCNTQMESVRLPKRDVPYQRFFVDENTEVLLYIYDSYGIQNNIYVKKKDSIYCSKFEVDPIPIVKMVRHDTVFLEYHNYVSQGNGVVCRQSIYNWAQTVGPYKIINCRHFDLTGSTQIQCGNPDSINMREQIITLFKNGNRLFDTCVNNIVFEMGLGGNHKVCFSKIDTISGLKKTYCYTIDTRKISYHIVPQ